MQQIVILGGGAAGLAAALAAAQSAPCYLQVSLHLYHSAFLLSEFNVRSAEVICHLHYCVLIT